MGTNTYTHKHIPSRGCGSPSCFWHRMHYLRKSCSFVLHQLQGRFCVHLQLFLRALQSSLNGEGVNRPTWPDTSVYFILQANKIFLHLVQYESHSLWRLGAELGANWSHEPGVNTQPAGVVVMETWLSLAQWQRVFPFNVSGVTVSFSQKLPVLREMRTRGNARSSCDSSRMLSIVTPSRLSPKLLRRIIYLIGFLVWTHITVSLIANTSYARKLNSPSVVCCVCVVCSCDLWQLCSYVPSLVCV